MPQIYGRTEGIRSRQLAVDDALDGGQADAGPGELGLRVQPLERAEEPAGVGQVAAGAIITHKEN